MWHDRVGHKNTDQKSVGSYNYIKSHQVSYLTPSNLSTVQHTDFAFIILWNVPPTQSIFSPLFALLSVSKTGFSFLPQLVFFLVFYDLSWPVEAAPADFELSLD